MPEVFSTAVEPGHVDPTRTDKRVGRHEPRVEVVDDGMDYTIFVGPCKATHYPYILGGLRHVRSQLPLAQAASPVKFVPSSASNTWW